MFHRFPRPCFFLGMVILGLARISHSDANEEAKADYKESFAGIDIKMVWIDAGSMTMGSFVTETRSAFYRDNRDEVPPHRVSLSGFWLGKYEVTQDQWLQLRPSNPSAFPGNGSRPVESISWNEAMAFCGELSEKTGKSYTLPTEAQWEFACRAGTASPFYTGFKLTSDQANINGHYAYRGGSYWRREVRYSMFMNPLISSSRSRHGLPASGVRLGRTTEVGSYPSNAWGLYDMHGNVSEWCADYYYRFYYRHSPLQDPPGAEESAFRVVRGGSWLNPPISTRSANRSSIAPLFQTNYLGFRIARLP